MLLASIVPMFFIAAFYFMNRADQDCGSPPELAALSERELEVMRHVARGRSNAEIAVDLVLAETTVKTHVASVASQARRGRPGPARDPRVRERAGGA